MAFLRPRQSQGQVSSRTTKPNLNAREELVSDLGRSTEVESPRGGCTGRSSIKFGGFNWGNDFERTEVIRRPLQSLSKETKIAKQGSNNKNRPFRNKLRGQQIERKHTYESKSISYTNARNAHAPV